MTKTIFPAIDLLDGQCVRLYKGDYDQKTVYNDSPFAQARAFRDAGSTWLHVVDLNGAKKGERVHAETIADLCQIEGLNIQVGGGIRTENDIQYYLAAGVRRVILGSVAAENPAFVGEMVAKYGAEKIVVGLDARDGYVSVHGWQQSSGLTATALGRDLVSRGVTTFIFTDISTDGTLEGPNVEACAALATETGASVIVSGGVGTLADIKAVNANQTPGIAGVIVGRALYAERFTLEEALEVVQKC
ncbi:MAG: 1-(5-phosphoribosyl)-5-[(5-phosphoribosylamino)methylideneamino]imidazole-4-carboxamide isomerase [Bacilli bacterium]